VSAAAYRARSATELIDATFQLLRRNAAAFFTLSALFTIPNTILQATFMRPALTQVQTLGSGGSALGGFLVYYVCALVLGALFQTSMMIAASDAYLGKPVVVADDLKQAVPKWLMIFIAFILTSILVGLGAIAFFVGAIYVALVLFAVIPVVIFENVDVMKAISRSSTLSKDLKGHIFLTLLLAGLIYIVGFFIVLIASGVMLTIPTYGVYAQLIVQGLGLTLIVPIFPIVFVLLYYDARIRKEGFDIELMAQQVGGTSGATNPQPA
jgi:hypothetical protein